MTSVSRLMEACVSVMTRALPASFAVMVASEGSNGDRSVVRAVALMKRMGMICVTTWSSFGMESGLLPDLTGMSRFLADSLETMVRVRPVRRAV